MDRPLKLSTLLDKDSLSESEVVHIFALIRKELEAIKDTNTIEFQKFDHLKLICDWTLHIEINRSLAGSSLVIEINRALADIESTHIKDTIEDTSRSLFSKFRNQLEKYINQNSLPTKILTVGWKSFFKEVLEIILDVPVSLVQSHRNQAQGQIWTEAITITKIGPRPKSPVRFYHLRIFTNDSKTIEVPITPDI